MTLVDGLARLLAGDEVPAPVALPPGVTVRASRLVTSLGGFLSGMGAPAAAVTLGRTVLVRPGTLLTERLVRHELAHVTQWNRHPVTFPFRYIGAHIRHGYQDNPYEREARAAEAARAPEAGGAE